jgi:hypothetical protein
LLTALRLTPTALAVRRTLSPSVHRNLKTSRVLLMGSRLVAISAACLAASMHSYDAPRYACSRLSTMVILVSTMA